LIDVFLLLKISRFYDFVVPIYLIEFEIKVTTDTASSASYLDIHLEFDSEGRIRTKLYVKEMISIKGKHLFSGT
jgi:hypothetical protein